MTEIALTPRYTLRLAARGCPTVNLPVTNSEMASAAFQRYRDTYGSERLRCERAVEMCAMPQATSLPASPTTAGLGMAKLSCMTRYAGPSHM